MKSPDESPLEKKGKNEHHRMMIRDFKKRFIVSMVITVPILILSPTIQTILNYSIDFPGVNYVLLSLAVFIYIYGGWPFLKGLIDEIKDRSVGMMTLIALAISVAFIYSAAVALGLEGTPFFWELATLIDIMLLGHWIEIRSVLGASKALEELAELMPSIAHLVKESGEIEDVELQELKQGDIVLIKPGEKIPSDGIIVDGSSYIDESMLTGESVPVEKEEGDELIGGSVNGDGSIKLEVKNTGEDSYLAKVIEMVRKAQESKSKSQRLADKAALWLTIIAITVGMTTLVIWLIIRQDIVFALERMATVMVITCPHALGLAIPLVVAVSTTLSAKNGFLIRNRTAFEQSRKIDTMVFDKTGTLTEGTFSVNKIQIFNQNYDKKDIIKYAAALERKSEHPIAKGIMAKAREMDLEIPDGSDFEAVKGKGIIGVVESRDIKIVGPNFLREENISMPENLERGPIDSIAFVLIDENELIGAITLSDKIRKESYDAIKILKKENIACWMLTGDNDKVAKSVSDELGLDGYYAELLPDEKLEKIKERQEKGEFVAMTGDGINDAPALAQADVGIAVGSGTDVAAETADIILVESNPKDVSSLIRFGKATYKKIVQNLIWATGYNVFAIPLAAGVLINLGIIISPAIGAILMSISTVIVAINAKLLRVN